MKHFSALLAAAAILLGSCSEIQNPEDIKVRQEIELSVHMGSYGTKATDTAFENGDEMNLMVSWGEKMSGPLELRKATFQNGKLTLDNPLYWPETSGWEEADFIVLYPYQSGITAENLLTEFIQSYPFTVNADQSTHELYTASDIISGGAYEIQESESPCIVEIKLAHMLSKVAVNITNNSDIVIKDVFISGVYGTYDISQEKTQGSEGTIKTCKVSDTQWACIIPPQGNEPKIIITTTEDKEISFKAPYEIDFPDGEQTNILITLGEDTSVSDFSYEIANWSSENEYNFSGEEWESLGTGQIQDQFFGSDFFSVEIERNKADLQSFRIKDPYSGIKQAYYSESSATPDEYLYFSIFDKGETYNGVTVTRDNYVYFHPYATGNHYTDNEYDADVTAHHPSYSNRPFEDWQGSFVSWFQEDGMPGQVYIAPFYLLDNCNVGWNCYHSLAVTILFPGCSLKTYNAAITASEDVGYGKGIVKENGKVYLSFNVAKSDADISSMRVAIIDRYGYYYSELFDIEDGLIDSHIVSGDSKDFLIEIPDDYATHTILLMTFDGSYPQYCYSLLLHDSSADNDDWRACGKGTYKSDLLGNKNDLVLYRNVSDNLQYKISPWMDGSLLFKWNNGKDNTLTVSPNQEISYGGEPVYVSDYTSIDASTQSSYYQGEDYLYHDEGKGIFHLNMYYFSDNHLYGNYSDTFVLSGSAEATKAAGVQVYACLRNAPVCELERARKFSPLYY